MVNYQLELMLACGFFSGIVFQLVYKRCFYFVAPRYPIQMNMAYLFRAIIGTIFAMVCVSVTIGLPLYFTNLTHLGGHASLWVGSFFVGALAYKFMANDW